MSSARVWPPEGSVVWRSSNRLARQLVGEIHGTRNKVVDLFASPMAHFSVKGEKDSDGSIQKIFVF